MKRRLIKRLIVIVLMVGLGLYYFFGFADKSQNHALVFLSDIYHRAENIFENIFIEKARPAPAKERKIIWCASECFWLDNNGQAFALALETKGDLVPLVVEESDRELKLRSEIIRQDQAARLLEIIDFLKITEIDFNRIEVGDLSGEDAWIEINQGPTIYFSLRFSPMFGLGVVKSLKEPGKWENIKYIDLRAENKVFFYKK